MRREILLLLAAFMLLFVMSTTSPLVTGACYTRYTAGSEYADGTYRYYCSGDNVMYAYCDGTNYTLDVQINTQCGSATTECVCWDNSTNNIANVQSWECENYTNPSRYVPYTKVSHPCSVYWDGGSLSFCTGVTLIKKDSAYCGFDACQKYWITDQTGYTTSCAKTTCTSSVLSQYDCVNSYNYGTDTVTYTCPVVASSPCTGVICQGSSSYNKVCTNNTCGVALAIANDPDCISPPTTILTPSPDASTMEAPQITWVQKDVTRYELLISKTTAFATGDIVQTKSITGATYYWIENWGDYLQGSSYWFKLRTVKVHSKGTSYSDYTTAQKFTKAYGPPSVPVLNTISGTVSYPYTLQWAVPTGGRSPYSYTLSIDGTTYTTSSTSYSLPYLASGTHTIKIKALDSDSRDSGYSTESTFSVSNNVGLPAISNITQNQTLTYPFTINITPSTGGVSPYTYKIKIDATEYTVTSGTTSYSLPSLVSGIAHTIQVKAKDAASQESAYTSAITFQVSNVPGTPTVINPTSGQTITTTTITWSAPIGGVPPYKYTIKLDGIEIPNITTTSYTPNLRGTSHTLQIKSIDAGGIESAYSQVINFYVEAPNAPRIISPLENGTVAPKATLRWEATSGGVQPYTYKVRVCSDSACNNVFAIGTVSALKDGEWKYTSPTLTTGPWKLEIYAIDANGVESTIATRYVTVADVTASQITKPVQNAEVVPTVKIEWTQATGGAGEHMYTVRVLKGTTWTSTKVHEFKVDGLSYTMPSGKLLNGEYYYVIVKAEDKDGYQAVASAARGFSVVKVTPTITRPTITSPGATGVSVTSLSTPVSIIWESIGQGATYTMEVSDSLTFSNILYTTTTTSLTKDIPAGSVTSGGKVYVRIKATVSGEDSQWSVVREVEYKTSLILECSPACATGQVCQNGVCVTPEPVENKVSAMLVEVPNKLVPGETYFIKANIKSTTGAISETFTLKISNGGTTLYSSSFDMQATPQGENKGFTIDLPEDLEATPGTYTIQLTDSKGVIVASAEVPYKSGSNPIDDLGIDMTTLAVILGCAGAVIVAFMVLRPKSKKVKATLRPIKSQFPSKHKKAKQKKLNSIKVNKKSGKKAKRR